MFLKYICTVGLRFSLVVTLILPKIMWKGFLWKSQPLHQYDFKL